MCNILDGKWKKALTLCTNVLINKGVFMNRLFNAKVEPGSWVLLFAVLAVTAYLMWTSRNGVVICIMLLLLVVLIERIIHSNYTVTSEGMLIVHTGRFSKDKTIDLSQVRSVKRMVAMRIFGKEFRSFVVIECADGRILSLIPREEEKFLKHVRQHMCK